MFFVFTETDASGDENVVETADGYLARQCDILRITCHVRQK